MQVAYLDYRNSSHQWRCKISVSSDWSIKKLQTLREEESIDDLDGADWESINLISNFGGTPLRGSSAKWETRKCVEVTIVITLSWKLLKSFRRASRTTELR